MREIFLSRRLIAINASHYHLAAPKRTFGEIRDAERLAAFNVITDSARCTLHACMLIAERVCVYVLNVMGDDHTMWTMARTIHVKCEFNLQLVRRQTENH